MFKKQILTIQNVDIEKLTIDAIMEQITRLNDEKNELKILQNEIILNSRKITHVEKQLFQDYSKWMDNIDQQFLNQVHNIIEKNSSSSRVNSNITQNNYTQNENGDKNLINNNNSFISNNDSSSDDLNSDNDQVESYIELHGDLSGRYYIFNNSNANQIKFYFESLNASLDIKFNDFEQFPIWRESIQNFCSRWRFDDITKLSTKYNLDKNQKIILSRILNNSIASNVKNYILYPNDPVRLYNNFFLIFRYKYNKARKNKMWKEIFVDEYCYEPWEFQKKILNLIKIENGTESSITHTEINEKILSTLKNSLHQDVANRLIIPNQGNLHDLSPQDLISYIIEVIIEFKKVRNLLDDDVAQCSTCGSTLHHSNNCLKFKILHKKKSMALR